MRNYLLGKPKVCIQITIFSYRVLNFKNTPPLNYDSNYIPEQYKKFHI